MSQPINVLIVDDSAVARAMIARVLRLAEPNVGTISEAGNGLEGLLQLQGRRIDLLLVDINMPVMGGEEMIERVRANAVWAELPIVVVSTEGSQTRIDRLMQKNVRFVHKPFTPEIVSQVLTELLGAAHAPTSDH
jgi:two-component system chemotaxis response regulator CheY